MKLPLPNKWPPSKNYWNALPIAILIGIFCYYFAENFVLSDSWEVVSLRSIDDYAMQASVHKMQKAILAENWEVVFFFFEYAYGNAFWLLNSFLLLPLHLYADAQTIIVAGRQISLLFVFGSLWVIGWTIDKIRPDANSLKYPILIVIATMPMVAIISTKLHVNAQSVFFSTLAFYFLVRDEKIKWTSLLLSALFAGAAVGFKLTGIFITPLLGITLLDRLCYKGILKTIIGAVIYIIIFIIISAACTAPALLLFPYYIDELNLTYNTFLLFKNMASEDVPITITNIVNSLQHYLSPLGVLVILALFSVLVFDDIKKGKYITLYILGAIVSTFIVVIIIVHKQPIYIATYFLNLAFFIPLGLLGIRTVTSFPGKKGTMLAYCIVAVSLISGIKYREAILKPYDFFAQIRDKNIKQKMSAREDMRKLISPLKLPVRILQDNNSLFPASSFTEGVDVAFNYGDLKEKSMWGDFNYILLSATDYYGKLPPKSFKEQSADRIAAFKLEESTRQELLNTGNYYGRKYSLIYNQNDVLLYKLEQNKK